MLDNIRGYTAKKEPILDSLKIYRLLMSIAGGGQDY